MTFIDAPSNFMIGRTYDISAGEMNKDEYVYYDSRDLTTHALVLGMTGSGKTGLCVTLLEEAILDGLPAIIVDPKGDIGNLMLTFADYDPAKFEEWIDADEARRKEVSVPELAQKKAELWQNGHADWGISAERMQRLKNGAEYTIYTPGSDAGIPVSILASLRAPRSGFEGHEEQLREQINGLVTAILSLAGISAEPVKDKEHVLMSNILEYNWRAGVDLTLEDVIMQVQEPPFEKLGVFPVDKYMPEDERFGLAMELNNVIASPSFQLWLKGVPMDIQSLLYQPDGKPRVSIFYIAHLNETERMFVMTLVLESLLGWMRNQPGTGSLRALLYIDEIFGYFPPTKNPPSKEPLMRMLKQARAFGVGVMMATQNPVDLDYKGLSNIGTWFIGRLQSDGDRDRIMAGLQEMADSGDMNLSAVKQMVADLRSRVFLMRNVHNKGESVTFHSRWAMNYLAGPMTRNQIGTLMDDQKANLPDEPAPTSTTSVTAANVAPDAAAVAATPAVSDLPNGFTNKPPVVEDAIQQFYLPITVDARDAIKQWEDDYRTQATERDSNQIAYQPVFFAQANVRYNDRKSKIRCDRAIAFQIPDLEESGFLDWEDYEVKAVYKRDIENRSERGAIFADLPVVLSNTKRLKELQGDLVDLIYNDYELVIPFHEEFEVYCDPNEADGAFQSLIDQAIRERREVEVDKLTEAAEKKIDKLEDKLATKERELQKDERELQGGSGEQIAAIAEGVLGVLSGKRTSTSLSKISKASSRKGKLRAEVDETKGEIEDLATEIETIRIDLEDQLAELQNHWDEMATEVGEYHIKPFKKDIVVELCGIAWVPNWSFMGEDRIEFAPAFVAEEAE